MVFYKICQKPMRNGFSHPYWVTKVNHPSMGECYRNMSGGCCPTYLADELESVEFPDEEAFLDSYRREVYHGLLKPGSSYGWLSPDGTFYGCGFTHHQELAELYFGKFELEMEKAGWVKVSSDCYGGSAYYYQLRTTSSQRDWLESHGVIFDSKAAIY